MKINVKAAALAVGIFWGLGLLFFTWWIILFEGATGDVTMIGKVYRGYNISVTGSFIGFVWGFIDGVIGGAVLAWLYNSFSERFNTGRNDSN